MPRPYDLPSMTGLLSFEAAARHQNFKAAAAELNVTPAAISQQVKLLESDLGRTLFYRHSRGVQLTEAGARLFGALNHGLQGISDSVSQVRRRAEGQEIIVQTTVAISSLFLIPRIAAFLDRHESITVKQVVGDFHLPMPHCDICLLYGRVPEDSGENVPLFGDRILALGAPSYAKRFGAGAPESLRDAPLVHLMAPETGWIGWPDWFAALGIGPPIGRPFTVTSYMLGLRAAEEGVGAVLGWEALTRGLVEAGRLVPLAPQRVTSPMCYYVKINPGASREARLLVEWLARG